MLLKKLSPKFLCFLISLMLMLSTLNTSAFAKSECIEQKIIVNQQEKEIDQLKTDLKVCKAGKQTIIDKLGFVAVGAGLLATGFHPVGLAVSGYLIIFN